MPPLPGSGLETWCFLHPRRDFILFVRLLYVRHICVWMCVDDCGFIPPRYFICLTKGRNSHEPIMEGLNVYVYLSIYLYIIRCWLCRAGQQIQAVAIGLLYVTVIRIRIDQLCWVSWHLVSAYIQCIMLFSASWWSLYRDLQMYTW